MDVDHSFLPGLPLLDNELIRLDLVPSQLEDVSDPETEVDASTDQQSGIVAVVCHQALYQSVGLSPPEGGGGAFTSRFCHVLKVRPGGYKNRPQRRKAKPRNENARARFAYTVDYHLST